MNGAGGRMTECGGLPVFRLVSEDGGNGWDFGRSLASEIAGRGLRLLIVCFPPGTEPTPLPLRPMGRCGPQWRTGLTVFVAPRFPASRRWIIAMPCRC